VLSCCYKTVLKLHLPHGLLSKTELVLYNRSMVMATIRIIKCNASMEDKCKRKRLSRAKRKMVKVVWN
jgi:hypothetical protein